MTIKAYDGTTWQTQKSLKIYNGSSWSTAKQAWIYNGTSWLINYPEFPSSSSNPSITVSSGLDGRLGCTYSASVGSWNSNDAYVPTSYTYQWTRSGSDISGATSSTYTTVSADAESVIGVKVRATNQRGNTTTSSTTGTQMLPHVTSLTGSNTTQSVSTPTVSFNPNGLSYSGSWNSILNATTYETTSGGSAGSPSVNIGARTFNGTGTAGNASFSVRAVNTTRRISLSWPAAIGAVSYDLYVNGTFFGNVGNVTSYVYNPPDDSARNFTIYPRTSGNVQGYGSSVASAIAAAATRSDYGTGSGNLVQPNATSPTFASSSASTSNLSVSWGGATNATKYRVYWTTASSISLDPAVSYDSPEWTGTAASYSISGSEGSTYYFYISASGDNNVWTPYGSYKTSATIAYTAPGAPSPSTSGITSSSFTISWSAVSGAAFYSVKVGTSSGGTNIVNTTTTNTSYSVSSLSSSTTYYVTIAANKTGYGYGGDGTASATTTAAPPSVGVPTVQFERTGSQIKWGIDNPSFSGAFTPFGIEWEVRTAQGGGTAIANSTINYTTSMTRGPVNGYNWNYWVRSTTDLPYSANARYLRCRLYGQNDNTFAIFDGPWSSWI